MIAALILNYNSYDYTIKLVDNLKRQTYSDGLFILIVDNCSINDSYSRLKHLYHDESSISVIKTDANLGYARGNNLGLHYLDEHIHPEFVVILNNDVILPDDCLDHLSCKYGKLKSPAVISPIQLDINRKEVPPLKMNSFLDDCLSMFTLTRNLKKLKNQRIHDDTGMEAMTVEMISGSFMFVSFDVFKRLGFFYPNTFLYVEERFVAYNVRQAGLFNYLLTDLSYIHAHSKTIDTMYKKVNQVRMVFQSRLEFTKVCRSNGKIKAVILKALMPLSLFELRMLYFLKTL